VKESDSAYLVGNLAFGRKRSKMRYWLKKLNGNVILILGSYDRCNLHFYCACGQVCFVISGEFWVCDFTRPYY